MSAPEYDGQPMTKREVLIAREAYTRRSRETYSVEEWERSIRGLVEGEAAMTYPLPKVTRPRVVRDPRGISSWGVRVPDGLTTPAIHLVTDGGEWCPTGWSHVASAERVALWADLLARPTEEVDA
jgi:hypothetical protein